MGQAAVDLPDPLDAQSPQSAAGMDDLLAQLAGDEIDRLLAEAEAESPRAENPAAVTEPADPDPDAEFAGDTTTAAPTGPGASVPGSESSEILDGLDDALARSELLAPDLDHPPGSRTALDSPFSAAQPLTEATAERVLDDRWDDSDDASPLADPATHNEQATELHAAVEHGADTRAALLPPDLTDAPAPPPAKSLFPAGAVEQALADEAAGLLDPAGAATDPVGGVATLVAEMPVTDAELETSAAERSALGAPPPAGPQAAAAGPAATAEKSPAVLSYDAGGEAGEPDQSDDLPVYLRPLEWINAPLAACSEPVRDAVGKVAIITLVNAVAVLIYVILFMHR